MAGIGTEQRRSSWWYVLAAAWALAMAPLTTPSLVSPPPGIPGAASWLDGSWVAGLNMAGRQHLTVGSRILTTYGPDGFLEFTIPFYAKELLVAVAVTMAIHMAFIACLAVHLFRGRRRLVMVLAATAVVVSLLRPMAYIEVEGALLAALAGILALELEGVPASCVAASVAGVALALLVLVKASGVAIAAFAIPVLVISALLARRRPVALALGLSFLLASGLLWHAAGLGAGDVVRYVRASVALSGGYSSAMATGGLTPWVIVGAVVLMLVLGMAVISGLRRRLILSTWLLLTTLLLFVAFKDTFVRDGPDRDRGFFGEAAVMAVVATSIATREREPRRRRIEPAAALLAPVVLLGIGWRMSDASIFQSLPGALRAWQAVAEAAVEPARRRALEQGTLDAAVKAYAPLIHAAQLPRGATADLIGIDVGYFYADHNVVWDPRPVLQSYEAFVPWLDQQDAAFYASTQAPEFVLYRYLTPDGRYPLADEPQTLTTLMQRYEPVRVLDVETVLLKRRPQRPPGHQRSEGRTCAAFGEPIAVPQQPGRWVFGRIDMGYSISGRLLDLAAKPAEVRINLRVPNGIAGYRLVWPVAQDGVYLSTLVVDPQGVARAFQHVPGDQPVMAFAVSSNAPWEWQPKVCVDFFSIEPPTSP